MTVEAGVLYVVATPIGNLADFSTRAVDVLRAVTQIYAEDTRHSASLMSHYRIPTPLRSLHEHNEESRVEELLGLLQQGQSLALISDAGTPLISDPGYKLVRGLRSHGIKISPVPGACALISALSVAGLPTDRFSFEGFLPAKGGPRKQRLDNLKKDPRTLVFYEAPHRIEETIEACAEVFGGDREAVLGREISKTFETFLQGTLTELLVQVRGDSNQQRGEMVLMVSGNKEDINADELNLENTLSVLLQELPLSQAVSLAERLTGASHKWLYKRALALKKALD